MPRQKISEYRAKTILYKALDLPYVGWSVDSSIPIDGQLKELPNDGSYVVKVDEAVKGRFKKGLVVLDVAATNLPQAVSDLSSKGYRWLIIEPMLPHDTNQERYLSLISERQGLTIAYASAGGVNIEEEADAISKVLVNDQTDWPTLAAATALEPQQLQTLVSIFRDNYFAFLEINPYVVAGQGQLAILDAAVEVDDAAAFFIDSWSGSDLRRHSWRSLTPQEETVLELNAKSPASFKLDVLEPNGSIFLLLSGGGASVLIADEIYNQGYGKQLANYGEYSGNPNTEETYIYTKAVLQLLLNSSAPNKILFIGGAVANFTDIAQTFAGVIQAINEAAEQLSTQKVKVFVRRGGPNQETGLAQIKEALNKHGLLGSVHDPETTLTAAVSEALSEVAKT